MTNVAIMNELIDLLEGVSKVSRLTNSSFTTISSQISAIYIHNYLSQKRGSDGHFEVLNGSVPQLVQKLCMSHGVSNVPLILLQPCCV